MLVIGENLNTSRKKIAPLVEAQDKEAIQAIAKKQEAAGAHYIDVNCGTFRDTEVELLSWMVDVVQEVVAVPLSIDTPNHEAAAKALEKCKQRPFLNSISGESDRYEPFLDLVKQFKPKVVTLAMGDKGMPTCIEDRLESARELIKGLTDAGSAIEDIYLDPLIFPVGSDQQSAKACIETIGKFEEEFPGVQSVCGLSNISYGLPVRKVINQAFLVMMALAGMKAVIINPLDNHMMALLRASMVLTGQDDFCMDYITADRAGKNDFLKPKKA